MKTLIKFGTECPIVNENTGSGELGFKEYFRLLGRVWNIPVTQQFNNQEIDWKHTATYVVRHRLSWDGIDYAEVQGELYQIIAINMDSANLPTSYDQVTLKKTREGKYNG